MELSKLEEIKDLRKIWPKEDIDFTRWLAKEENINLLGDTCGINIVVEKVEESVGPYRCDIYAKDTANNKIIIENQLEKTDHDHLGKLITYASGKDAKTVIWIAKDTIEQHRQAIEWLNKNTGEDINFFLIEIKLYKIDNSNPAVKFEIIEQPNDWGKSMKAQDNVSTPTETARKGYWNMFNEYAFSNDNEFSKKFNKRRPSTDHWMTFNVGSSAYHISVTQVRKYKKLGVEFYIPNNQELYENLYKNKKQIEEELGFSVEWMPLVDRKASRIITYQNVDFEDEEKYNKQFQWIMDTAVKMKDVIKKYI